MWQILNRYVSLSLSSSPPHASIWSLSLWPPLISNDVCCPLHSRQSHVASYGLSNHSDRSHFCWFSWRKRNLHSRIWDSNRTAKLSTVEVAPSSTVLVHPVPLDYKGQNRKFESFLWLPHVADVGSLETDYLLSAEIIFKRMLNYHSSLYNLCLTFIISKVLI